MPANGLPTNSSRLRLVVPAALLMLGPAGVALFAQPFQVLPASPAPIDLAPAQLESVVGSTLARLEQVRALAADQNWPEAIDILQELTHEKSNRVVSLGDGRYVTLRTYCHLQLASLPAEGLVEYRRRVDALAERWYRQGMTDRDERALGRVVDELYCSSWGDDALLALGEMALERADYAAARRCWEQISPKLRDPVGRPLWLALRNIDLSVHWPQVETRWHQRPDQAAWLAYPGTDLDLAAVRARLILVSIRAGDLKRAASELDAFRRFHPDAVGRIGGHEGPYADSLLRLIETAKQWASEPPRSDWPTFAGSADRSPVVAKLGPITGPMWADAVEISGGGDRRTQSALHNVRANGGALGQRGAGGIREMARSPACFPVFASGMVLYNDAGQIRAVRLDTGDPADWDSATERFDNAPLLGHSPAAALNTMNVVENIAYGQAGRPVTSATLDAGRPAGRDRIIGVDLDREGLLSFSAWAGDRGATFEGAPVGDGRRLFVAMRQGDITRQSLVACFEVPSGRQLWMTRICTADVPGGEVAGPGSHNLLSLVGDRLYFNSNLGVVAAMDTEDGTICWLRAYERSAVVPPGSGFARPLHFDRDPSPCLVHGDLVIAAPADTPSIFALDTATGQLIWSNNQLPDGLHLLGVVRQMLIVGGHRLAAVDLHTGTIKYIWPESQQAGIRGMGRGLVAGDEVFWPTRNEIFVIHALTGAPSRRPIPLRSVGEGGANLAAAQGRLIAAGDGKLMALGPALPLPRNRNDKSAEPIAANADAAPTRRHSPSDWSSK